MEMQESFAVPEATDSETGHRSDVEPLASGATGRTNWNRTGWLVVLGLIALQFFLITQYFQREITWGYPMSFDQLQYLERSYDTFDHVLSEGPVRGLIYGLMIPAPQGIMIQCQAALLFLWLGASRMSALDLNLVYFFLLQVVVAYTLLWYSRRWSVVFLGLGLLASILTPFEQAGSLADFRIDFIAMCLFGIFICLALRSNLFLSRRWSLAAGACTGMLILFRFLWAPAMLLIYLAVLAFLGYQRFRGKNSMPDQVVRRVTNVIAAGVVVTVMALPGLWANRAPLNAYYIGQVTTHENDVRNKEFGVNGRMDALLYYPSSLYHDHLGSTCVVLCIGVLLLAARGKRAGREASGRKINYPVDGRSSLAFMLLCLAVPLTILTAFPSPSPVVGSILVPPFLGLALGLAVGAFRTEQHPEWFLPGAVAVIAVVGFYTQVSLAARRSLLSPHHADIASVFSLYDEIGDRAVSMGLSTPSVAFDRIHDYLYPMMLDTVYFERHGVLLKANGTLGMTVMPESAAEATTAIKSSDFVVLTEPASTEQDTAMPFNQSMLSAENGLFASAQQNLVPVREFEAFSQHLALYMRLPLKLEGNSGEWITSKGADLVGPVELLRQRPHLELGGRTIHVEFFQGNWAVRAQLLAPGQPPKDIPATITAPADNYTISIQVNPADLPAHGNVKVHFALDKYFVPKEIHDGVDTRQLSIMAPQQMTAVAQ